MSKDELISLRIESFMELKRLYADVMHGRYDNTNTRQRLEVVEALHAAVCREIAAAELPAGGDRDAILAQEALHVLDAFMQDHPEHCVQISVACEMIRGIGKGGDREILPR